MQAHLQVPDGGAAGQVGGARGVAGGQPGPGVGRGRMRVPGGWVAARGCGWRGALSRWSAGLLLQRRMPQLRCKGPSSCRGVQHMPPPAPACTHASLPSAPSPSLLPLVRWRGTTLAARAARPPRCPAQSWACLRCCTDTRSSWRVGAASLARFCLGSCRRTCWFAVCCLVPPTVQTRLSPSCARGALPLRAQRWWGAACLLPAAAALHRAVGAPPGTHPPPPSPHPMLPSNYCRGVFKRGRGGGAAQGSGGKGAEPRARGPRAARLLRPLLLLPAL